MTGTETWVTAAKCDVLGKRASPSHVPLPLMCHRMSLSRRGRCRSSPIFACVVPLTSRRRLLPCSAASPLLDAVGQPFLSCLTLLPALAVSLTPLPAGRHCRLPYLPCLPATSCHCHRASWLLPPAVCLPRVPCLPLPSAPVLLSHRPPAPLRPAAFLGGSYLPAWAVAPLLARAAPSLLIGCPLSSSAVFSPIRAAISSSFGSALAFAFAVALAFAVG